MIRNIARVTSCIFILVSCNFWEKLETDQSIGEPVFRVQPIWTLESRYGSLEEAVQDGKHPYIVESNYVFREEDEWFRIGKADLDSGTFVWKSATFAERERTAVVRCGDHVFVQTAAGNLLAFSDANGTIEATISFAGTPEESVKHCAASGPMKSDGSCLYWIRWDYDESIPRGIARLDISRIDWSEDAGNIQIIEPDPVGEACTLLIAPLVIDSLIIYLTYNRSYREGTGTSELVAYDISRDKVRWRRNLSFMNGSVRNSLQIVNDILIVTDMKLASHRMTDGSPVYEIIQTEDDLMHEVYLGGGGLFCGIFHYGNMIYYTSGSHCQTAEMAGTPEKYNKNIGASPFRGTPGLSYSKIKASRS